MARARQAAAPPASWRPSSDGILEAAERVFDKQGYGETSLRQLIAEAGVSTTAFYARFDSKDAVLAALVARLLTELHQAATEALGEARSLEDGFERGVHVLVKVLAGHRAVVRLALTEAAASEEALATLRRSYGLLAELLRSKLTRLVERGEIEVADAEALGWALVGALQMQVTRWAVYDELSDKALVAALRSTANALLPAVTRRRGPRRPAAAG